jgi:hypothetical protein
MVRFIRFLLLGLGVGFILIPVVDAEDNSNDAYSQLFLFHVDAGATWEPGESPLTKGKSMPSLCVPVRIVDQASSQPLGSGKVCLSGQDKQKEAISERESSPKLVEILHSSGVHGTQRSLSWPSQFLMLVAGPHASGASADSP